MPIQSSFDRHQWHGMTTKKVASAKPQMTYLDRIAQIDRWFSPICLPNIFILKFIVCVHK